MSYFGPPNLQCNQHPNEWNQAVKQIKEWKNPNSISGQITQPLEAKALYIFTIAHRLIVTSGELSEQHFIEATILLFPMLELIGYSRLDVNEVSTHYNKQEDVSNANIWAGLHWLRDPNWLPKVTSNKLKREDQKLAKWQIGHLTFLRHYFLHGAKKETERNGKLISIPDIISYELPKIIIQKAKPAMSKYWELLKQDDGKQGWLERLAQADIQPLKIQGSVNFEYALVDPDIVDYLEEN